MISAPSLSVRANVTQLSRPINRTKNVIRTASSKGNGGSKLRHHWIIARASEYNLQPCLYKMSSPFVFPGSARSHESLYKTDSKHFGAFGDNDAESPLNNPNKKSSSTPIENPLLFRTSPPSFDRNNHEYENVMSSPLASVSVNKMGTGILRQRKMSSENRSNNSGSEGHSAMTKSHRVLPPRASYSLGTNDVSVQRPLASVGAGTTVTSSSGFKSSGSLKIDGSDREMIGERGRSHSAFSFDESDRIGALAKQSKEDSAYTPRSSIDSMYSPSQVKLTSSASVVTESKSNIDSTWVFVFGATLNSFLYEELMRTLSEFGRIVTHRSRSNWIAVRYQSELEAEKALCNKRMKLRNGGDTVYFTAQRLLPNDPEMRMVSQSSSYQPAFNEGQPVSLWTGSNAAIQNESTNSTVVSGRLEDDGGLYILADKDDVSEDTVKTTNRKDAIGPKHRFDHHLTEEDVLETPHNGKDRPRGSISSQMTHPRDSLCIKLLKWALAIDEDEYD